jgi:hypothetical protein
VWNEPDRLPECKLVWREQARVRRTHEPVTTFEFSGRRQQPEPEPEPQRVRVEEAEEEVLARGEVAVAEGLVPALRREEAQRESPRQQPEWEPEKAQREPVHSSSPVAPG